MAKVTNSYSGIVIQKQNTTGTVVYRILGPWLAFHVYLMWAYRISDPFHQVPAYGDLLEVLWGMEWYHYAFSTTHVSPLFTPMIFYPLGWHTATLAHTPMLFLLAQPLFLIGGPAFAYNLLVVLSQYVAFAGCYRFVRLYTRGLGAVIAALMFTFWHMRWFRAVGHLHIFWAVALLPWMVRYLRVAFLSNEQHETRKNLWISGILWGLMINFSLYSLFLGGWAFLLSQGRRLFKKEGVFQALHVVSTALFIGGPVIILYYLGAKEDGQVSFGITHTLAWGASLNSLVIPSVFHPLPSFQHFARTIYTGPLDESGVANIGSTTWFLAVIGTLLALRQRGISRFRFPFLLVVIGSLLSLGLLLRWNGKVITSWIFQPVDLIIWKIGHFLKPSLFTSANPHGVFRNGFPLPGFMLTAVVPFWESARVASRYAFITVLGLLPLAAKGINLLPKVVKYIVAIIWLLEFLPVTYQEQPATTPLHPAYTWASQHIQHNESIVEIQFPSLRIGGDIAYATLSSDIPTVSGVGSFWPQHTFALWDYLLLNPNAWRKEETVTILRTYHVRYVMVYMFGDKEQHLIEDMKQNQQLQFVNCFDAPSSPTPWPTPICIVEVLGRPKTVALLRTQGWSGEESWGVWAEGTRSEADLWITERKEVKLTLEVFPHCVPLRFQSLTIQVNGRPLVTHQWHDCSSWTGEITIPLSLLNMGKNQIEFHYAYAARPADVTQGQNGDTRWLSVGFTKLEIEGP